MRLWGAWLGAQGVGPGDGGMLLPGGHRPLSSWPASAPSPGSGSSCLSWAWGGATWGSPGPWSRPGLLDLSLGRLVLPTLYPPAVKLATLTPLNAALFALTQCPCVPLASPPSLTAGVGVSPRLLGLDSGCLKRPWGGGIRDLGGRPIRDPLAPPPWHPCTPPGVRTPSPGQAASTKPQRPLLVCPQVSLRIWDLGGHPELGLGICIGLRPSSSLEL